MKRFLVFAFDTYYPDGGWNDFQSSWDSLDEARAASAGTREGNGYDHSHIVDGQTGRIEEKI